MKFFLKFLIFLAAVFGILLTVFLFVVSSFLSSTCGNTISDTAISPTQEWKVVLYSRSCGATTGYSTHISILKANESLPNEGGNTFTADDSERRNVQINLEGLIYVEAEWLDATTVLIKYDSLAYVHEQDNNVNGITINYKKVYKGS
jgi:hypothetical protein